MPKFNVGDRVERVGSLIPQYMQIGIITRIILNEDGVEMFTEYEVNFGNHLIALFYETQLRLVNVAAHNN
jgi:hypothetical protein